MGGEHLCLSHSGYTFDGASFSAYRQRPYWRAVGELAVGMKVFGVRYRRKYYITNRLSLTAQEVRTYYKIRHEVEEVIRVLKSPLSLEACQVGYRRPGAEVPSPPPHAQEHHMALCLVAYLIVERERLDHGVPGRKLQQRLIRTGTQIALPALGRMRKVA